MKRLDNRPEAVAERIGLAREAAAKEVRRQRAADGRTEGERRSEATEFVAERIATKATPTELANIVRAARKAGLRVDAESVSEQAHQVAAQAAVREEN